MSGGFARRYRRVSRGSSVAERIAWPRDAVRTEWDDPRLIHVSAGRRLSCHGHSAAHQPGEWDAKWHIPHPRDGGAAGRIVMTAMSSDNPQQQTPKSTGAPGPGASLRVGDVMTSPVLSVLPTTTIGEAARLMLANRISGLPVVAPDGSLTGMISEGDLLRRTELGTESKRPWWLKMLAEPRRVREVMVSNLVTIGPDAPLDEAVTTMGRRGIKRLPVVREGQLLGIITRSDLVKALIRVLPVEDGAEGADDDRIRRQIITELDHQPWVGNAAIRVGVVAGVVALKGTIFDERVRAAAKVAAENVAGVREVRDELVWIEPISGMMLGPPGKPIAGF
jgi:CBS domain-containing protein